MKEQGDFGQVNVELKGVQYEFKERKLHLLLPAEPVKRRRAGKLADVSGDDGKLTANPDDRFYIRGWELEMSDRTDQTATPSA